MSGDLGKPAPQIQIQGASPLNFLNLIDEREELYTKQAAYGKGFPASGTPYAIGNNQQIDGKLQAAVFPLSHGRCRGALGIRAEHIKAWL